MPFLWSFPPDHFNATTKNKTQDIKKANSSGSKVILRYFQSQNLLTRSTSPFIVSPACHHDSLSLTDSIFTRAKVRVILERLLRRFGYEMIHKLASEEHKKVVNHIVKEQRRAKAAKSGRREEKEESEEEDGGLESEGDEEIMEDFKQLRGKGARAEVRSQER